MVIDVPTNSTPERVRCFVPQLPEEMLVKFIALVEGSASTPAARRAALLREVARQTDLGQDEVAYRTACLVLADLVDQGWIIRSDTGVIHLAPPSAIADGGETMAAVKHRLRSQLEIGRDRQLREPPVQEFLRRMERRREFNGRLVSVRDVIDSGYELAEALAPIRALPLTEREEALAAVIDPIVEVCDSDARCAHTGIPLLDIWRYFRHTWSLEYRPTPGRTLPFLIRNAARSNAPIIGIAMLASAATRVRTRDLWIGWDNGALHDRLETGTWDAREVAGAMLHAIDDAVLAIRSDDFRATMDMNAQLEQVVQALRQVAAEAERARYELLQGKSTGPLDLARRIDLRNLPKDAHGEFDWRAASERPLFKRKRAATLAQLLSARAVFAAAGIATDAGAGLRTLLATERGRVALNAAFIEMRKRALSSNIADVSVCGAVTPYNELLGGKLVTLLINSEEVRRGYSKRYENQVSEIASQLAGEPVRRSAELLLVTTTSLYGVGSSQYNRLHLRRSDHPELDRDIQWLDLGHSGGFGTAHLSRETVESLRFLSTIVHGARRINSIFGEGASPRLRQVREGLEALGIESDAVLHHATPRGVYVSELVPHAREKLLGIEEAATIAPAPTARAIAAAWRRRWLAKRIDQPEVLERVASIGPGTVVDRLMLPPEGQLSLSL